MQARNVQPVSAAISVFIPASIGGIADNTGRRHLLCFFPLDLQPVLPRRCRTVSLPSDVPQRRTVPCGPTFFISKGRLGSVNMAAEAATPPGPLHETRSSPAGCSAISSSASSTSLASNTPSSSSASSAAFCSAIFLFGPHALREPPAVDADADLEALAVVRALLVEQLVHAASRPATAGRAAGAPPCSCADACWRRSTSIFGVHRPQDVFLDHLEPAVEIDRRDDRLIHRRRQRLTASARAS